MSAFRFPSFCFSLFVVGVLLKESSTLKRVLESQLKLTHFFFFVFFFSLFSFFKKYQIMAKAPAALKVITALSFCFVDFSRLVFFMKVALIVQSLIFQIAFGIAALVISSQYINV